MPFGFFSLMQKLVPRDSLREELLEINWSDLFSTNLSTSNSGDLAN